MNKAVLSYQFELLKKDLIAAYDAKGMRASGDWANALEVDASELNAKIIGLEYSQQLETGRKAGRFPNIGAIEKWIRDKGIAARIDGKIKVSALAFLIARKIAREGWKREEHGGVELISEVVTDERIQKIIDEIGDATMVEYSSEIIRQLMEIAA